MKTNLPKVVETGDRKNLSEGRDYQMGFTLLMPRNKDNAYVSLYPFSCCKDYLNDWAFTYLTGEQVVSYGLITDSKKKFTRKDNFYFGIKILPYNNGKAYEEQGGQYDYTTNKRKNPEFGPMKSDQERLKTNIENIVKLLNWYDVYFKVPNKAKLIRTTDENTFIIRADVFWLRYGYRISFYSLLIRMAQFWNGEGDPRDFIENKYKISLDSSLFNSSRPKYNELLEKGMPELNFSSLKKRDSYIDPDTDLEEEISGGDEDYDYQCMKDVLGDHKFFDSRELWADSGTIHNGGLQNQLNSFKDFILK